MAEKCSDAAIRQSAKHGNAMEPQKKGSTVQKQSPEKVAEYLEKIKDIPEEFMWINPG